MRTQRPRAGPVAKSGAKAERKAEPGAGAERRVWRPAKRQDDWAVVPNLWGLAVGPPGLMKSPALAEALRPLSRLVSDAHAQYEEQMLAHHFRLAEAKARRHDLTRRLRDAFANDEPTADVRQHFEGAPAYRPPVAKRYLVNSAEASAEMRITGRVRPARRSSSRTFIPESPGICISSRITSGWNVTTALRASMPVVAV